METGFGSWKDNPYQGMGFVSASYDRFLVFDSQSWYDQAGKGEFVGTNAIRLKNAHGQALET